MKFRNCVPISIVLLMVFQAPGQATPKNPSIPPDSDGNVPTKKVCHDKKSWESWLDLQRIPKADGTEEIRTTIYVDVCDLRALGAGPRDIKNFVYHERAHSKGFNHGEGTPETNAAYYPMVEVTGR